MMWGGGGKLPSRRCALGFLATMRIGWVAAEAAQRSHALATMRIGWVAASEAAQRWAPHADQLVDMCDRQIIGLDLFTLARTLAACQHREGNLLREAEVSLGRRRLCFACRACGVSPWGRYRSPHRRCLPERAAKAPGRTGPPPAPSTAAA